MSGMVFPAGPSELGASSVGNANSSTLSEASDIGDTEGLSTSPIRGASVHGMPVETLRIWQEQKVIDNFKVCASRMSSEELWHVGSLGIPVYSAIVRLAALVAPCVIRLGGVRPMSRKRPLVSTAYQWLLVLIMLGAIGVAVARFTVHSKDNGEAYLEHWCWQVMLWDILLPLSGVLGLRLCGAIFTPRTQSLSDCLYLLGTHAHTHGYLQHWAEMSCRGSVGFLMIWLIAVGERCRAELMAGGASSRDERAALGVVGFAVSSGVLLAIALAINKVCLFLTEMVDNFCCRFVEEPDFTEAVREWSVLQALLRMACMTVQHCFVVLQLTALVIVMCSVGDAGSLRGSEWLLVPPLLTTVCFIKVFLDAAAVTDKCARVPAFINSLSVGKDLDDERMYVVEYIERSQAGFYVLEVRLDTALALKLFYFSCVAAFGVATKVFSPT